MRAACGSYFVTMYKTTKLYDRKQRKKEKKRNKEKERHKRRKERKIYIM